ncbi:hypothetical protein DSCW_61920 [Desulfosarcina widdelii]|uniref:Uncharacterized protein n=1 Tax=Desulfosarcina widdelii TaxID=947919 RepID=A0A5K7ZDC6_9BACT|nr:hypothetical protein [Desulfosarcina widdelii]BBO78775.1 hypothetical protein DSCW_61920 [Desulfosarcina widdelii]
MVFLAHTLLNFRVSNNFFKLAPKPGVVKVAAPDGPAPVAFAQIDLILKNPVERVIPGVSNDKKGENSYGQSDQNDGFAGRNDGPDPDCG